MSIKDHNRELPLDLNEVYTDIPSTMARSFSLALNDLFKIDGSLADLDAAVDQKYVAMRLLSPPKSLLTPSAEKELSPHKPPNSKPSKLD